MSLSERKEGFKSAIPLIIGYIPLSITFGLVGNNSGFSFLEVMMMTALIYSGAGQFMLLNLLSLNIGVFEIIFTITLLNSRMFLMATSFVNKIEENLGKIKPYISLTLTDETFSVSMFRVQKPTKDYIFSLNTVAYFSWIIGAIIGYFFGNILPDLVKEGLGITLYAMFVSMLMPEIKKSKIILFSVLFSGAINTIIKFSNILPEGWGIILGITISSLISSYIANKKHLEGEKNA